MHVYVSYLCPDRLWCSFCRVCVKCWTDRNCDSDTQQTRQLIQTITIYTHYMFIIQSNVYHSIKQKYCQASTLSRAAGPAKHKSTKHGNKSRQTEAKTYAKSAILEGAWQLRCSPFTSETRLCLLRIYSLETSAFCTLAVLYDYCAI